MVAGYDVYRDGTEIGSSLSTSFTDTSVTPGATYQYAVSAYDAVGDGSGETEAVTVIAHSHVPDEVYEQARQHFTDDELAKLTLAIVSINGWNRLNIAFRTAPGGYQPIQRHEHAMA